MMNENRETNMNDKLRVKNRRMLLQDISLLFFLACLLCASLVVAFAKTEALKTENLVMFLLVFGSIILAAYRFRYLSIALSAVQTCFYAAYKIYQAFRVGDAIPLTCYAWLLLPLATTFFMLMFMQATYQAELVSDLLEKQLKDQVMTDRVTGLYNLKSMYMDLERQIAYSRRNNLNVSLMLMELRYQDELRAILSESQFDDLRVILARILEDSVRLEDRLYALSEDGPMAIICTCDRAGAEIMKRRILNNLEKSDQFREVLGRNLRIEIRTGIYQYIEGDVKNAIDLKKKAENEMQYDV